MPRSPAHAPQATATAGITGPAGAGAAVASLPAPPPPRGPRPAARGSSCLGGRGRTGKQSKAKRSKEGSLSLFREARAFAVRCGDAREGTGAAACCGVLYAVRSRAGKGGGCRDRGERREKSQPLSFLVDFSRSGPRNLAAPTSNIAGIAPNCLG